MYFLQVLVPAALLLVHQTSDLEFDVDYFARYQSLELGIL